MAVEQQEKQVRQKKASETYKLKFKFARLLETTWEPGEEYALNDFVRPTKSNGREYEATAAGQSGSKEPIWPGTLGATVADSKGDLVWTARAFATNATDTISTRSVAVDTGLTLGVTAIDGTDVTAIVSGGTKGSCYEVMCIVTTAQGEIFEEIVVVEITD